MNFSCTCGACGYINDVEWSQVGKEINCGGCRTRLKVPAPRETVGESAGPIAVLRFVCPSCGRKYATKPAMAGKKIRCNGCGVGVWVPMSASPSLAQPLKPTALTDSVTSSPSASSTSGSGRIFMIHGATESGMDVEAVDSSSLLDELVNLEGGKVKSARRVEPALPSRTEAMELIREKIIEQEALEAEKAKQRKKKKRRQGSGYFDPRETLQLVGGVTAFVAVLAFLAWGYPDLRFPLGGLLCLIGFVVYLVGAFALRQLVADEGFVQLIAYRFFPPYQWWFIATHWAEAKGHFIFFASGFVILSIGGAVIKTSDVGKKAEESDRAYRALQRGDAIQVPPVMPVGADANVVH